MRPWLLCILALTGACNPSIELGEEHEPIIGGSLDIHDPAVVALRMCVSGGCSSCTGTLVGAETVLTASHCIDANALAGRPDGVSVFFGSNVDEAGTWIVADELLVHRYYDPESLENDVAMVHLSEPAPVDIDPVVLSARPLSGDDVGRDIRLVGFGETGLGEGDTGIKRQVESVLTAVSAQHMFVGTETANTCKGDSGGPTFSDFGAGEVQIGVTSRSRGCAPNSVKMRVDVYLDEIIIPFIDHHEGPCALDGACESECPSSPDPDCDPCLRNGTCGQDCAEPDWDCPLGKADGDACADDLECEGRVCQAATDDPRIQYCTRSCDPQSNQATCPSQTECVDPDGTGYRCVYLSPSPGALGAGCGLDSACRSGICEDGICVERCDQVAGGSCPAPFECRDSQVVDGQVCGPPLADGGCGCTAQGRGPSWLLGLAVLLLLSWRRSWAAGRLASTAAAWPARRRSRRDRR